jgi:hypothetical protein
MNAVEAYIEFKPGLFTDTGEITDENVATFLSDYMEEYRNVRRAGRASTSRRALRRRGRGRRGSTAAARGLSSARRTR